MGKRDHRIIKAAKAVLDQMDGRPGFVGKKNMYVCTDIGCGSFMVTVDREAGVTPFMAACWGCKGFARSRMYRVDQTLEPTHEWYRPDSLKGLSPAATDHVLMGGLMLRQIAGPTQ